MSVVIHNFNKGTSEESDGLLFESGNKVYLVEKGEFNGTEYVEARELYTKNGRFGRTQKAARIAIEDVVEFLDDFIKVTGLPLSIVDTDSGLEPS